MDTALDRIKHLPISKEAGEQGHAGMKRESDRAPAASRAWKSAAARLPDNSKVYDGLADEFKTVLDTGWNRHKLVIQFRPDRARFAPHVTYKLLLNTVYRGRLTARVGQEPKHLQLLIAKGLLSFPPILAMQAEVLRKSIITKCFYRPSALQLVILCSVGKILR